MALRGWKKNSRGQAILETALAIPLILLVIMGIVELGRMMFIYDQVTNAAREGARWAAVQPSSTVTASLIKDFLITKRSPIYGVSAANFHVKVQTWNPGGPPFPLADTATCVDATAGDTLVEGSTGGDRPKIRVRACANMDLIVPGFFSFLGNPRVINGIAVLNYER